MRFYLDRIAEDEQTAIQLNLSKLNDLSNAWMTNQIKTIN